MANPSKAKGTRAETKVARYLSDHGLPTERRALAGSADQGDLRMTLVSGAEVTIEVKTGKQTASYNRSMLEEWKRQTLEESRNSKCSHSMLVIVRYRRSFCDAEVWTPNFQWEYSNMPGWTMRYIDEFVEEMGDG
jgi:Holliday junction resolvase